MTQVSPGHRSQRLIETQIRILEWNIWWRFGSHWQARQPLIMDVLKRVSPDIVTLQEVWGDERSNQAAEIAESLSYFHAYEPASFIDGLGFGNAVLSLWSIEERRCIDLPSMPSDDGSRDCKAVYARIAGPRGDINVLSTHLSYKPEESAIRQRQVTALEPNRRLDYVFVGKPGANGAGHILARISHQPTAAGAGLPASTALRSARVLDVLASTPARSCARAPCRYGHLHALASRAGEKCGLAAGLEGREAANGLCPSDHYALSVTLRY